MKKLWIFILVTGCFINPLSAQQAPASKYNELGISFSDLNNFGFRYKHGNDKTMFRLSMISLNLFSNDQKFNEGSTPDLKQTGMGLGLRIGFDKRIPLYKTFSLLLGGEFGLNYRTQTIKGADSNYSKKQVNWSINPGISFIFGVNYVIKDHLVLGAELNPTLSYGYGESDYKAPSNYKVTSSNLNFSAYTSGAGLYIAYRFGK